jgi:hypothetical protein
MGTHQRAQSFRVQEEKLETLIKRLGYMCGTIISQNLRTKYWLQHLSFLTAYAGL